LEEERNYLLRMCPKDKHKDYDEGKETTLVRVILNTLPAEYDNAVHHVRNLMAIREMVKGGDIESITNLDDAVKINYDTSWLPPYRELRVGLVNAWMSKKRRWDEEKSSRVKEGHPTMMIGEEGKAEKTCFGCGLKGHVRGAPECKAGSDAIWGGAPKAYLEKVQRKFGKIPTFGKRPIQEGQRPLCKFHQEGFCKYAERCHFEHAGQGGSKRPKENGKGKTYGIKIDKDYWVYKEALEKDYFCKRADGPYMKGQVWPGECNFPDYTNPEVREWWAGLFKELISDFGVKGVWNDMNEPSDS
jgi:hypothetical protein